MLRGVLIWSALTCQRFGLWRLDAILLLNVALFETQLRQAAATKATTGRRTPNQDTG